MPILASLCNTSGSKPSPLILIEDDLSAFRWARLPAEVPGNRGACGLAIEGSSLYVALQTDHLAILNLTDLSVRRLHKFERVGDVHSLIVEGSKALVVGTRTDTVFGMEIEDGKPIMEKPAGRPDPDAPQEDVNHLNSIQWWRGTLLISGLGRREGPLWDSARNGFIRELSSGRKVADGLYQPHTLARLEDTLMFCESSMGVVRDLDNARTAALDGFTRGLSVVGRCVYAATSRGRMASKSTGVINPDAAGRCALYRLGIETFKPEAELDFGTAVDEIYDLIHIEDRPSWTLF